MVGLLAEAGARVSGGHADDLRRELLTRLAAEVQHDLAYLYARAAEVNGVSDPGTPRLAGLRVRGPLYYALPRAARMGAQPYAGGGRIAFCWRGAAHGTR